jgi:predicted rRNA methylase YqxC with S4 and FtsJ domains
MIENTRLEVFELIETMPNKFPTFKFLDNRLFLFFRLALVDGFRPALKIVFDKDLWIEVKRGNPFVLKTGASFGPFTLTLLEKPAKYIFTLNSFFFNCKTGYSLKSDSKGTVLTFDLAAKNPGLMEKIWWFFVKPIHAILANKVLKRIKKEAEIG